MYLASCSSTPEITTRTIALHVPAACAVPDGAYAQYFARGDFQPTIDNPAEDFIALAPSGALQHLPASAQSIGVQVTTDTDAWIGLADVPSAGNVDVLLWGVSRACALSTRIIAVTNPAFGAIDARRAIISGGRPSNASVVPPSYVIDLTTGRVTAMATGPLTARERATISRFGDGGLLAGGVRSDDPNGLVDNAEAWSAQTGDFDGKRINLSLSRADHAAVTMISGDVLLVGGTGSNGKPIATPEIVLREGRSTTSGLPILTPRSSPTAMRLVSGEILVAGGFDANGAPVGLLETLSPDAHRVIRTVPFIARPKQAFIALDGGGALAVLSNTGDPPDLKNVWRISSDGGVTPLAPLPLVDDPRLFPSSAGGARLWTGSKWLDFGYRSSPWTEVFREVDASDGPTASAIAPEPGLAIWLTPDAGQLRVDGRRFSIRNAYTAERAPLASFDLGPIAPDRSPATANMSFDSTGLFLPKETSAFVADARYADFVLDATLVDGEMPIIVLRDETGATYEIGGVDCPAPKASLHVERIGYAIGTDTQVCKKPLLLGRVAVGFRGQNTTLQNIRVRRMVN